MRFRTAATGALDPANRSNMAPASPGPGFGPGWMNLAAGDNRTRRREPLVIVEHVMRHGG